jgi:hypothetical protein
MSHDGSISAQASVTTTVHLAPKASARSSASLAITAPAMITAHDYVPVGPDTTSHSLEPGAALRQAMQMLAQGIVTPADVQAVFPELRARSKTRLRLRRKLSGAELGWCVVGGEVVAGFAQSAYPHPFVWAGGMIVGTGLTVAAFRLRKR